MQIRERYLLLFYIIPVNVTTDKPISRKPRTPPQNIFHPRAISADKNVNALSAISCSQRTNDIYTYFVLRDSSRIRHGNKTAITVGVKPARHRDFAKSAQLKRGELLSRHLSPKLMAV